MTSGDTPSRGRDLALRVAVALLALPAGTVLSASAGFALGRATSALDLLGGVALAAALVAWGAPRRRGVAAASLALALAVAAAALALAPLRYDTTFDGQAYHEQATLALARGWNPLGAPLGRADFENYDLANHFPKGCWIAAAAVYRLTGRFETAKLFHLVLAAAAFAAGLSALLAVPRLGRGAAVACAALAALDTVAFVQLFTFYVDGQIASAITAFVAFAYLAIERRERLAVAGMALATVLLVNAKLTGVPYAVLLWAGAGAAALLRLGVRGAAPLAAAGGLSLAVAVLGPGWNPYVTNTLRDGHPFHPVAGARARDIVYGSRPEAFARMNRVERLLSATFSASSGDPVAPVRLKPPFTVVEDEATKFHAPDVRLGGFGPLFSGALVLAALALLLASRRGAIAAALVAAALVATVLVTAEGWWARLAPQLWLVPIVLALAPLAAPARRGARLAGALVLAALALDAGLVAVNNLARNRTVQRAVRLQLEELARMPSGVDVRFGVFEAAGVRLSEAGVRWRAAGELACAKPVRLAGTPAAELCASSDEQAR